MFFFSFHRELQEGTIKENGLIDGSKIILTPNVETGLLVSKKTRFSSGFEVIPQFQHFLWN
jgi:hypothetical protein